MHFKQFLTRKIRPFLLALNVQIESTKVERDMGKDTIIIAFLAGKNAIHLTSPFKKTIHQLAEKTEHTRLHRSRISSRMHLQDGGVRAYQICTETAYPVTTDPGHYSFAHSGFSERLEETTRRGIGSLSFCLPSASSPSSLWCLLLRVPFLYDLSLSSSSSSSSSLSPTYDSLLFCLYICRSLSLLCVVIYLFLCLSVAIFLIFDFFIYLFL
jgi:hypothetical protein